MMRCQVIFAASGAGGRGYPRGCQTACRGVPGPPSAIGLDGAHHRWVLNRSIGRRADLLQPRFGAASSGLDLKRPSTAGRSRSMRAQDRPQRQRQLFTAQTASSGGSPATGNQAPDRNSAPVVIHAAAAISRLVVVRGPVCLRPAPAQSRPPHTPSVAGLRLRSASVPAPRSSSSLVT